MSASLVGSEMCIRDRHIHGRRDDSKTHASHASVDHPFLDLALAPTSVSYTHLTLPTICSV
eukprot:10722440-Alexandrium_andersonii.AAC.1